MPDEILFQAQLKISKFGQVSWLNIQDSYDLVGSGMDGHVQLIGTAVEAISLAADIGTVTAIACLNLETDPANWIEFYTDSGGTQIVGRAIPGSMMPLMIPKPAALWAKAAVADCKCSVVAAGT